MSSSDMCASLAVAAVLAGLGSSARSDASEADMPPVTVTVYSDYV